MEKNRDAAMRELHCSSCGRYIANPFIGTRMQFACPKCGTRGEVLVSPEDMTITVRKDWMRSQAAR